MSKKNTIRLLVFTTLVFLLYWSIHLIVLSQIKTILQDINDEKIQFKYTDVDLSLLKRSLTLTDINFFKGEELHINIQSIQLSGIDPYELLKSNKINAASLDIQTPKVVINSTTTEDSKFKKKTRSIDISINKSSVKNGSFTLISNDTTHIPVQGINVRGNLKGFMINEKTLENKIPFVTSNFLLKIDTIQFPVDAYHKLYVEKTMLSKENFEFIGLHIIPLLDRQKFHQVIPVERDYINLKGERLLVKEPSFFDDQETSDFCSEMITFDRFHATIYRDKRIRDDTSIKPLYSKMLREMDTKIAIDSILISNSTLKYTEHPDSDADAGVLEFHNLNLHSGLLSNILNSKPVDIKINTLFMNQAPMKVKWMFNINDPSDFFTIKGSLKNVQAVSLNSFLTPVVKVKAKGALDELYFNFNGNVNKATGDMQLSFEQFDVSIYDQETKKIKSFLSSIANMLIGGQEDKGLIKEEEISVKRDHTKSFWNYFWLCIRNGLFKIIV